MFFKGTKEATHQKGRWFPRKNRNGHLARTLFVEAQQAQQGGGKTNINTWNDGNLILFKW